MPVLKKDSPVRNSEAAQISLPSAHLLETSIDGVISTLIIRESLNGECTFYSISDSMDVSKMKKTLITLFADGTTIHLRRVH